MQTSYISTLQELIFNFFSEKEISETISEEISSYKSSNKQMKVKLPKKEKTIIALVAITKLLY